MYGLYCIGSDIIMGGIEGVDIGGFSGVSAGGYSDAKDTKSGIRQKITSLESKLEEAELKQQTTGKSLSSEIQSLQNRIDNLKKRLDKLENPDNGECQTCKNRKYRDGSDDPGVSFKSAAHIDPENASAVVKGHEMEHVYRNRAKAEREGREVVSQTVTLHTGICPECGKPYVSGGETRTVTRAKLSDVYNVGIEDNSQGKIFDSVA